MLDWLTDPQYRPAVFGLVGVSLGAFIGLVGTWYTTRHNARLTRLAELRHLYVELLGALESDRSAAARDRILDEMKDRFSEETGVPNHPSVKDLERLDQVQRETLTTLVRESSEAANHHSDVLGQLLHLGYQARLLAPRDTSKVVDALVISATDPVNRNGLLELFTEFGRRDMTPGLGLRHWKSRAAVGRLKRSKKYKRLMTAPSAPTPEVD